MNNGAPPTLTEPIPPQQPPALREIFIGKEGLRAGWSLLIFFALLTTILFGVRAVSHAIHPGPPPTAPSTPMEAAPTLQLFIGELVPFIAFLLVAWIMSKIERRPNAVYGLGGRRSLVRFFGGLAWGIVCLSLLILVLWKTGLLVFDSRALFGVEIFRYGTIWLFFFLLVGLAEEYTVRGYLQYTMTRGLAGIYQWIFRTRHSAALGFWTSALAFSLLFGLGHGSNPGESPIGLFSAGLAGLVFCLSLWRTGSLWWAIGFHTSWDWAQSFLYGVADSGLMVKHHLLVTHPTGKPILSGGTTGPEGSIFVIAVLFLVSLIILFTLPRTPYSDIPDPIASTN